MNLIEFVDGIMKHAHIIKYVMNCPFSCYQDEAMLQFCAMKLDKKDIFGKSDPFLVFSRANENGTLVIVCFLK